MYRTLRKIVLIIAGAVAATLFTAGPAAALCPDGPCVPPDPGGSTKLITHTLTVARPSKGSVTSNPAGISCGADCDADDAQLVSCEGGVCDDPDPNQWQTYTLTAGGGGSGFDPQWSGCAAKPDKTCTAKLDADRNVSVSWQDVQNPSVTLSAPAAGDVAATMTVSATATDNGAVNKVDFLVDGVVKATDSTPPYSGSISMSGFADGSTHSVAARATDASGRITQTAARSVTVDRHVSVAVDDVPAFTKAATVPVKVSTDSDATLSCRLDAAPATACAGTYSPVTTTTPDGIHTYAVVATDDVGNTASANRSFVLDRTLPVISDFDGPPEGGEVSTSSVTMTFAVSDANLQSVACQLDGRATPCTTSATLSGLADGTHHFSVTGTDKAGNVATKTRTFSVRSPATTTPPPTGGTTSGTPGGTITDVTTTPARKRNPARLVYGYSMSRHITRLPVLVVKHVAKGSTIKVTCKGGRRRGCPRKKTLIVRGKHGTVRLKPLQRCRLRAGAVLTITISKPGMRTKVVKIRIRKHARPKVS